ncbi:DUF2029 domain-containing protein [bacterium]|nr:DUF2029 domain-containing protein [bacterium]
MMKTMTQNRKVLWIPALILFGTAILIHGYHFSKLVRSLPFETHVFRSGSEQFAYPENINNKQKTMNWLIHNPRRANQSLFDRYFTFDPVMDSLGIDFFQFYVSGLRLLNRESIYLDEEKVSWVPSGSYNRYPPLVAGLIGAPFTLLTPWHAYMIWLIFIELMIFSIVVVILRQLKMSPLSFFVVIPWLISAPISREFRFGQINVMIAAGTLAAYMMALRKRHVLAGIILSIITGIKLIPVLFLPYFWRTKARLYAVIALVILGLASLSYFAFYPGDFGLFMGWVINAEGANGVGFQTLLTEQIGTTWFPKAVGGIFVLAALWATWKTDEPEGSLLALWISIYFLVYKRILIHHFSLYYLGVALALIDRKRVSLLIPLAISTVPNAVASSELFSQILHSMASLWLYGICLYDVMVTAHIPNRSLYKQSNQ